MEIRILVVDDDPSLLGFTARYLTRLGYSVVACQSVEKAWSQCENGAEFQAVLLDGTLPALNGEDLALKLATRDSGIKIILMSGYPCPLDQLEATAPGRVSFLLKPFSPSMLASTVTRAVGAAEG